MELKRVLLKLSGEALAGDKKTGFDEATVLDVARQVKQVVDSGILPRKCAVGICRGSDRKRRDKKIEKAHNLR